VRPYCGLASAHFQGGRYQDAADAARRAIEFNPGFSVPHALLAAALIGLGRLDDAKAAARQVLALQPGFTVRGFGMTVGFNPDVFAAFAEAWIAAGLPET
jgi:tetratricopeptide (TPR) repeat protein